tara:strand:+ start:35915 stop:36430 length:516 start_codon:yes stop_codon:yes gene_type:complete
MKATERKALLRRTMRTHFETAGCELADMKAGPQNYTAIRQPGKDFNVAAIYGSRIGASLWIKEGVHNRLRDKYPKEYARFADVVDVDLFRRGFAWAIHFADPVDDLDLIELVCQVSLQWGQREDAKRVATEAAKQEADLEKQHRESERRERMEDKRSEWRSRKADEAKMIK